MLKFHFLDHSVIDIVRFESLSSMNTSLYKQFNTNSKASYHHISKVHATNMEKKESGLDRMQTNTLWTPFDQETNYPQPFVMKKHYKLTRTGVAW